MSRLATKCEWIQGIIKAYERHQIKGKQY
jgi:hypothetical protein